MEPPCHRAVAEISSPDGPVPRPGGRFRDLPYRLILPPGGRTDRCPLLLFLHGAGERGTDNHGQMTQGVGAFLTAGAMAATPFVVLAPQCPVDGWWSGHWIDDVVDLTKSVAGEFHPPGVVVAGLSMGGQGAWRAITACPGRFAAAAVACGRAYPEGVETIARVPCRLFHGVDDTVVPVEESRKMLAMLEAAAADVHLEEYPGVDHGCWDRAFGDPATRSWLFSCGIGGRPGGIA